MNAIELMSDAAQPFAPDVSMWDAWRPEEVARVLADVDVPWYLAGGWAIDLFLGAERRPHEDLEIAVPSRRFAEVADVLSGYEICAITAPGEATPFPVSDEILEATHQTWVRDPVTGSWRLDVFREPSDDETWICRRDESIRLPFARVIERTADGIPYGCPEVILLFKAKHAHEAKNEGDFAAVLPSLGRERRSWLAEALEVVHPGHLWLGELA